MEPIRAQSKAQYGWKATGSRKTTARPALVSSSVDPFGRAERVERSDGSVTLSSYSSQRRVESLLLDTDDTTVLRRTISSSDGAGNTTKELEDHWINGTVYHD